LGPWPLAAASRPPAEVMPSRSYLLKQWPTRPYQEDGAQLFKEALLASSPANDDALIPVHPFPQRTSGAFLRTRTVRNQHPLCGSAGRPPDAGPSRAVDGCALDISPSKRVPNFVERRGAIRACCWTSRAECCVVVSR
jgi:hypothetical protein